MEGIEAPTIEDFLLANADENGDVSDEAMARFLRGDFEEGDIRAKETPESGDSPTSTKGAAEPNDNAGKKEPEVPAKGNEPVVMAKDGEHTIPYSEFEKLRDGIKAANDESARLRQQLDEQAKTIEERLQKASQDDEKSGNSEATTELLSDLEMEFPGSKDAILKMLEPMQQELAALKQKDQARETEALKTKTETDFDDAVTKIHADYKQLTAPDNAKFWDWFHSQPSYIRAVQNSGDPAMIAEVITSFKSANPESNTGKPKISAEAAAKKVSDELAKLDEKNPVQSLSDIPGGSNPETDEEAAVLNMDGLAMLQKMNNWSSDRIEKFLSRAL